jgi:hypothetical protein
MESKRGGETFGHIAEERTSLLLWYVVAWETDNNGG